MNSISDTRNPTSSMLNVLFKDLKFVGGYFIFFYFYGSVRGYWF